MELEIKTKKRETAGSLSVVLACAIWGSSFFMVEDIVKHNIHPWVLTTVTMTLSSLVMLTISLLAGKKPFKNFGQGITLGVMLAFILLPQGFGLQYTTASNSGFITGLFIVFVPFVNYLFFKRKPAKEVFIAIPLALIGLWMLTGGIRGINLGDGLTLITAVACAFHVLYADRFIKSGSNPLVISFQQYATVAVVACIMALSFGRLPETFIPKVGLIMAYLIIFPNCIAFFLQFFAQKSVAPFKVSLLFLSESVFAALFSWTLGGEAFIPLKAAGGAVLVSAMVLAELGSLKNTAEPG
ncbi:MAG: DMT family transporter [Candidatus Firestonebacteria bacterium]